MTGRRQQPRPLESEPVKGGAEPRLAPWLFGGIVLVIATYTAVANHVAEAVPADRVERETMLLSSVLSVSAEDLLKQDRLADLDELLAVALQADEVFAAFVLGPGGRVVAGGAVDQACLPGGLPLQLPVQEAFGRIDCGAEVHWSATPLLAQGSWLVVAVQEMVRQRTAADVLQRQLLLVAAVVVLFATALTIWQSAAFLRLDLRKRS